MVNPQSAFSPQRFAGEFERLLQEPEKVDSGSEGATRFGRPDAVGRLADLVETLAGRRRAKEVTHAGG